VTIAAKPVLRADDIAVFLARRKIIERARVKLRRGEFTVLVGPNGAGKTTLVRALAGLIPADGSILLDDRPLSRYTPNERARHIAYLPQGNVFHWPLPVAEIVALGRHPHEDPFSTHAVADRAAVERALVRTATAELASRAVTTLSGGERARVALARALATETPVLLADEPVVSLDPRHQLMVMELLRDIAHGGCAVLAVVHDLALAARFADQVIVLQAGRIVRQGEVKDTLSADFIATVFGVNAITVSVDGVDVPFIVRPL
jgi:iron complex transport system ATP-binding protein